MIDVKPLPAVYWSVLFINLQNISAFYKYEHHFEYLKSILSYSTQSALSQNYILHNRRHPYVDGLKHAFGHYTNFGNVPLMRQGTINSPS